MNTQLVSFSSTIAKLTDINSAFTGLGCCFDCHETDESNSDDDSDEDSQDWALLSPGDYQRNLGEEFYDDKVFFVTDRDDYGNPTEVDKSVRSVDWREIMGLK
jgi:hypothetical protein